MRSGVLHQAKEKAHQRTMFTDLKIAVLVLFAAKASSQTLLDWRQVRNAPASGTECGRTAISIADARTLRFCASCAPSCPGRWRWGARVGQFEQAYTLSLQSAPAGAWVLYISFELRYDQPLIAARGRADLIWAGDAPVFRGETGSGFADLSIPLATCTGTGPVIDACINHSPVELQSPYEDIWVLSRVAPPASRSTPCSPVQWSEDLNYVYLCLMQNNWVRLRKENW